RFRLLRFDRDVLVEHPTMGRLCHVLLAALLILDVASSVRAQHASNDAAAAEIGSALEQWRLDFNMRKVDRICDLFAPELRYDFQSLPEQNEDLPLRPSYQRDHCVGTNCGRATDLDLNSDYSGWQEHYGRGA